MPNAWKIFYGALIAFEEIGELSRLMTVNDFLCCYLVKMSEPGFWFFQAWDDRQIVFTLPISVKRWKEKFFFVSGEGWEYQETEVVGPVTLGINLDWGDLDLNEIRNIQPEADDLEDIIKAIKKKSTGYIELVTLEKLFSLLLGPNPKGSS